MRTRLMLAGPALIFIAAILWGLDGILRRTLQGIPPITIVFYEHVVGAIFLLPFFLPAAKGERLNKKEWGAILVVSLLSGVLGTLWFTTALLKTNFISFSVVFLLQKLQPIFTLATAAIVLKEKIHRRYVLWALLAIAAAYFVTFPNGAVNLKTGGETVIAALFAVGAAFAWGSTTAFSRYTLLKHSHTFVTGLRFLLTIPMALLLLLWMGKAHSLQQISPPQILSLLMIALSTGMVALWIYYSGLKRTQAKVSTVVELAFPLTAVIIDIFLYDTVLLPTQYLAAAVLLFAIHKVSKLNVVNQNEISAQRH